MATEPLTVPFTADQLNRFRLTHPDKELRMVMRRLNRLPIADQEPVVGVEGQTPDPAAIAAAAADRAAETELARLDLEKWRLGVDRTLASVRNFQRQTEVYLRKADGTEARTEALKQTLVEEKALLAARLQERDHRVKCDEVAKKIVARGKTRKELEEQIETLKSAIADHRSGYEEIVSIANARSEAFARISALVDECRALKLPAASGAEAEVIEEAQPPAPRLNVTAMSFQPSNPASAASTAAAAARAGVSVSTVSASAPASRSGTPGPGHPHLPTRPGRGPSGGVGGRYARDAGLPLRPSSLRNVRGGSGLEDGELGEEDGEVKEGGAKRKAPEVETGGRSTRPRN